MFKLNIRPSLRCSTYFLLLTVIFGVLLTLDVSESSLALALLISLGIVLIDVLSLLGQLGLEVERKVSHTVPMGNKTQVTLEFKNIGRRIRQFHVFDHFPTLHKMDGLPAHVILKPNTFASVPYHLTFIQRGVFHFQKTEIRCSSILKLWTRQFEIGKEKEVRVYPNYTEVVKYGLMAAEQRLSQIGIHKQRRRGDGTDFNQLREFRSGDSISKVDWKASARAQKMIAKEFQLEQDQQVIFLLDCGRSMRAIDHEISHFDHTLNALLLLGSVAVRQGDEIGLMTMGGEERWMKPQKGVGAVNKLLNITFDLQTSKVNTDILLAAGKLRALVKKRALIIIISNLRDEASSDLVKAIRLLQQKHLVLYASLREEALDLSRSNDIPDIDAALTYSSLIDYLQNRNKTFKLLGEQNIYSLDVTPGHLANSLVNSYLGIKSSGAL